MQDLQTQADGYGRTILPILQLWLMRQVGRLATSILRLLSPDCTQAAMWSPKRVSPETGHESDGRLVEQHQPKEVGAALEQVCEREVVRKQCGSPEPTQSKVFLIVVLIAPSSFSLAAGAAGRT